MPIYNEATSRVFAAVQAIWEDVDQEQLFQLPPDHVLLPHQENFDVQTPGGPNRAFHFCLGRVVAAHGI